jgi:hypothetical protein
MNQRELIHRLKIAVSNISKNPKTAARVACLLEDFVASMEEIAHDLEAKSDEQVAKDLEEIVAVLLEAE